MELCLFTKPPSDYVPFFCIFCFNVKNADFYRVEKGLQVFLSLYLRKHLFLANRKKKK